MTILPDRIAQTTFLLLVLALPASAQTAHAKLDKSLRESVEQGCAGAQPVIITAKPGHREALRRALSAHGDVVQGEFPAIEAIAVDVHCDDLAALAAFDGTYAVSFNGPVSVQSVGRKGTGARKGGAEGQAASDLTKTFLATMAVTPSIDNSTGGSGIGVAVIDSGIGPGTDFDSRITAFYDFTRGDIRAVAPLDPFGHGTHVAGLIGSEFVGLAPNARLIGLRVLNERGEGSTDDVVRAIEFAIINKNLLGIHILNLSLGHPIYESAATDPLVQAVEHAVREGLVVVASAGNFGVSRTTGEPGYAGIVSPGNAPSALTVGSTRTFDTVSRLDDRVAPYSSRGPSWYDGFAKPDVVAPGDNLLSVAASDSALRLAQERRGNTGNYMRLSGTSMAAGVTTGVVALVLQANRGLTPNTVKAILEYSSIRVLGDDGKPVDALTQGAGQIQAAGALALARSIDPRASVGSPWLSSGIVPSTTIGTR